VTRTLDSERARLLALDDKALLAECEMDRYRASGAGGQKRNKTSSAVRLRHKASGITAHSSDSRSQHENKDRALKRLRECFAFDLREPVSEDYQPAKAVLDAIKRGPLGKNAKTRALPEYLLALAEILDVFEAEEAALGQAARRLGVTTGSLGKLLHGDERLNRRVAEARQQRGLKPLR
jgi:hypothetical protein